MEKHEDCQDRCQLNEHKGYRKCSETSGECEMLQAQHRNAALVKVLIDIAVEPYRIR